MLWYSGAIVLGLSSAAGGLYGMLNNTGEVEPSADEPPRRDTPTLIPTAGLGGHSEYDASSNDMLDKLKTVIPLESRGTADRIGDLFCKAGACVVLLMDKEQIMTSPQKMKILHQASSFMNLVRMHFDKLQVAVHSFVRRQNTQEEYRIYKTALRNEFDMRTELIEELQGHCLNLMT